MHQNENIIFFFFNFKRLFPENTNSVRFRDAIVDLCFGTPIDRLFPSLYEYNAGLDRTVRTAIEKNLGTVHEKRFKPGRRARNARRGTNETVNTGKVERIRGMRALGWGAVFCAIRIPPTDDESETGK